MSFHDPAALLLLIPVLLLMGISIRRNGSSHIRLPVTALLAGLPATPRQRLAAWLPAARAVAAALAIIALARPQLQVRDATVTSRGIDLALALDISTSMLAIDRTAEAHGRSRLQIAKEVTRDFISKRSGDRIGIVAFAARCYPAAPLTLDLDWLNRTLEQLETGAIEDGTALGDGLLAAINRLRSSPAASRTLLLITDGRNNAGTVPPAVATQAAKTLGIKVHTIGIGSRGPADFPVEDPLGGITYRTVHADLDEATLADIARTTGGSYFHAADVAGLRSAFSEIDRLEKRPITVKVTNSVRELFTPVLAAALILLLIEILVRSTWLRRTP